MNSSIDEVTSECLKMLNHGSLQKAPIELFWLLFLLSCDPNQHEKLAHESVINRCLDTCTYEIFQKSDPRSGNCSILTGVNLTDTDLLSFHDFFLREEKINWLMKKVLELSIVI